MKLYWNVLIEYFLTCLDNPINFCYYLESTGATCHLQSINHALLNLDKPYLWKLFVINNNLHTCWIFILLFLPNVSTLLDLPSMAWYKSKSYPLVHKICYCRAGFLCNYNIIMTIIIKYSNVPKPFYSDILGISNCF